MIPPRLLSRLSNRLAREGGRRIPETILERDYCLAWLLVALSRSPLRELLAFKGGTAIKRCYFGDYRFSEDLDFTLAGGPVTLDDIKGLMPSSRRPGERRERSSDWRARTARRTRMATPCISTTRVLFRLPSGGRRVKVDITIRERLVFALEDRAVLRGYEEYSDLPEGAGIRVYSLGEIAVEKVVALMDRARNEPRDLYDIWFLTNGRHIRLEDFVDAIEQKLDFRRKSLEAVRGEFAAKEARYRKLWDARLSAQMAALPEFGDVYRSVRRAFRQAGLERG